MTGPGDRVLEAFENGAKIFLSAVEMRIPESSTTTFYVSENFRGKRGEESAKP